MQGGTEYDEGRPYISAIDGPGGPIITGDHLTRDRSIYSVTGGSISLRDRTAGLRCPRGTVSPKGEQLVLGPHVWGTILRGNILSYDTGTPRVKCLVPVPVRWPHR